jgi:hypothetical protein
MEALFNALSQYIDFLVMGAVAFAVLCAPFGLRPLTSGWSFLDKAVKSVEGGGTFVQVGLIAGMLFAIFYFSGYFLNAIGAAFLHPGHIGIIDTVATRFDPTQKDDTVLGLKPVFFKRVIPVFGPFLSTPAESEMKNYRRDATRQIFWQVCDEKSAEEMLGGGILKELRLLRGGVGLTQILLLLCLAAPFFNRGAEHRWAWSLGTFAAAFCIYSLLIIPSYSHVEYDAHVTIWATFPAELDKDPDKIDVAHMDNLLPCRKMQIIAGQPRKGEPATGGSLPSPSNTPTH